MRMNREMHQQTLHLLYFIQRKNGTKTDSSIAIADAFTTSTVNINCLFSFILLTLLYFHTD